MEVGGVGFPVSTGRLAGAPRGRALTITLTSMSTFLGWLCCCCCWFWWSSWCAASSAALGCWRRAPCRIPAASWRRPSRRNHRPLQGRSKRSGSTTPTDRVSPLSLFSVTNGSNERVQWALWCSASWPTRDVHNSRNAPYLRFFKSQGAYWVLELLIVAKMKKKMQEGWSGHFILPQPTSSD